MRIIGFIGMILEDSGLEEEYSPGVLGSGSGNMILVNVY